MKNRIFVFGFLFISLILASLPQAFNQMEPTNGNITFQPNIIPFLTITERPLDKPESFRFEWSGNRFDIELFFNATIWKKQSGVWQNVTKLWSLRDFEVDFNVSVQYRVDGYESNASFGWFLENLDGTNEWVHEAWFKVEDTQPFDYDVIELEEIRMFNETTLEPYNVTRFHLPDNLVLSFEDLYHKGFVIGRQNKTATEVRGFSGKSSWNLDPIVYSGGIITVTGYTQASPCTFWDVWNASNVNGWNVVNHTDSSENNQFDFGARLYIGDGSTTTWFADTNKQILFNSTAVSANSQYLIYVKNNAHFRLGVLEDATSKTSSQGVSITSTDSYYYGYIVVGDSGCDIQIYSSMFTSTTARYRGVQAAGGKIYNTQFTNYVYLAPYGGGDFFNIDVSKVANRYGIEYGTGTLTFDRIFISENYFGIYFYGSYVGTFKNILARQNNYLFYVISISIDKHVVNVDADTWSFSWGGSNTAKVYRQYEFDLTTTANSTVEITYYGQGGGTIFNATDADGIIPTQTISKGFYNQTGGNALFSYEPFHLKISKSGYITYEANFTLSQKTSWEIALTPTTPTEEINTTQYLLLGGLLFMPLMLAITLKHRKNSKNVK